MPSARRHGRRVARYVLRLVLSAGAGVKRDEAAGASIGATAVTVGVAAVTTARPP
jgi:hypothetical protein